MNTVAIACQTIKDELRLSTIPCLTLFQSCRLNPAYTIFLLRKVRIQQEIDNISGVDNNFLLFGYCGNSITFFSNYSA